MARPFLDASLGQPAPKVATLLAGSHDTDSGRRRVDLYSEHYHGPISVQRMLSHCAPLTLAPFRQCHPRNRSLNTWLFSSSVCPSSIAHTTAEHLGTEVLKHHCASSLAATSLPAHLLGWKMGRIPLPHISLLNAPGAVSTTRLAGFITAYARPDGTHTHLILNSLPAFKPR